MISRRFLRAVCHPFLRPLPRPPAPQRLAARPSYSCQTASSSTGCLASPTLFSSPTCQPTPSRSLLRQNRLASVPAMPALGLRLMRHTLTELAPVPSRGICPAAGRKGRLRRPCRRPAQPRPSPPPQASGSRALLLALGIGRPDGATSGARAHPIAVPTCTTGSRHYSGNSAL